MGQRRHGVREMQREEGEPPPDGVRHVPEDDAEGAAIRRDGVVFAWTQ